MTGRRGQNTAASARDRLLALSRERAEDFQLLLTQYGLERLLYRLSKSSHRDRFILKGAMLFLLWGDQPHRPTRDVDFLGFGDSTEAGLQAVFRELCDTPVEDDGLTLMADSVQVEVIRDQTEYGGLRVRLFGDLAGARVPIQADIGFGDAVTPEAKEIEYPTLLGNPAPHLKAYPRETVVVAEKYQALVHLGMANSRMKDFYDLWVIAREFNFDGRILSEAIRNTFSRRRTSLPEHTPSGLPSSPNAGIGPGTGIQGEVGTRRAMALTNEPSLREAIAREEAQLAELSHKQNESKKRLAALKSELASMESTHIVPTSPAIPPSIDIPNTTEGKISLFRQLFRGRDDVFPKLWISTKTGRKGYSPACGNEWVRGVCEKPRIKCSDCPNQAFLPFNDQVFLDHLQGRHTIGVYPLLKDETCCFLAADFDKESWLDDVTAFVDTCRDLGIPTAVERSRSGNGAHVWLFFSSPIPAVSARRMGCYLITETMSRRHQLAMIS